jgi:preprotein translocase subunit YajC
MPGMIILPEKATKDITINFTNMNHFLMLGGASGGGQGDYTQFIFLGLILVVFYFFMIRPQMKKSKDQKKFRESLKKGDKVITIGGIHGKILDLSDTTVTLEMVDKTHIKFEKSAISLDNSASLSEAAN